MSNETAPAQSSVSTSAPAAPPAPTSSAPTFESLGIGPTRGLPNSGSATKPAPPPAQPKPADPAPAKPANPEPAEPPPSDRASRLSKLKDRRHTDTLLKMSNDAFNHWFEVAEKLENGEYVPKAEMEKALADREAELRKQVESARYTDHEEGYKLTPEFRKLDADLTQAAQVKRFWADQLSAFENGRPFRWLEEKDGKLVVTGDAYNPADHPEAKAEIIANISSVTGITHQLQREIDQLPAAHKTRHTQLTGRITELDTQLFGNIKNPDFTKRATEHLTQFPELVRNRPEFKMLANALAAGELFYQRIQMMQAELDKLKNTSAASVNSAPAPVDSKPAAGTVHDSRGAIDTINKMVRGR